MSAAGLRPGFGLGGTIHCCVTREGGEHADVETEDDATAGGEEADDAEDGEGRGFEARADGLIFSGGAMDFAVVDGSGAIDWPDIEAILDKG